MNRLKRVVGVTVECVADMGSFLFEENIGRGYHNCFPGKKWEDIVSEGSPYFPGGEMKGEAKINFLSSAINR